MLSSASLAWINLFFTVVLNLRWWSKCCWHVWSWGRSCPMAADSDLNQERQTSYNTCGEDITGWSPCCVDKCIVNSAIYREDTRITSNKYRNRNRNLKKKRKTKSLCKLDGKICVLSCTFTSCLRFLWWCISQTPPLKHWIHLWGRGGCGFATENWPLCLYAWTQAVEMEEK